MTVKTAEIIVAVILALCSIGLMAKSMELHIGWIDGKGPGSGAWPFWLSTGMLVCCLWTIVRWFRGKTPESVSTEIFITRQTAVVVGTSALSILFVIAATQWMGIYIALIIFLFVYLKFIGGHDWPLTLSFVICMPVFIFCLFEWALKISLPKAFTDPAFYPTYDLIYAQKMSEVIGALQAPINLIPILGVVGVIAYWTLHIVRRKKQNNIPSSNDSQGDSIHPLK